MIIEGVLVPDDILDVHFVCDTVRCRGACCVDGDAGAPLLEREIGILEDYWEESIPWMTEKAVEVVRKNGVFDYDESGHFVTPLVDGGECAFVYYEEEVARCALEKAFFENRSPFRKPESCHLYPVRVGILPAGDSLFYHKWNICRPALKNGKTLGVPMYVFLKEPLIRRYGESWYASLVKRAEQKNT